MWHGVKWFGGLTCDFRAENEEIFLSALFMNAVLNPVASISSDIKIALDILREYKIAAGLL